MSAGAKHVVVIGAGIGGLAAALDLAACGMRVTVVERQPVPGGKMREVMIDGNCIDSGPTVFTMRWVFEALFADAGFSLAERVGLTPATILARHSWPDGSRLDLHADLDLSTAAIAEFAGESEARAYRRFAARSQQVFETLDHSFMRVEKPGPVSLTAAAGIGGLPRLWATRPFRTLWSELGHVFRDPRLRQLFARYATYCGSSPFQSPATLMLITHAERAGVWLVEGGMQRLAEALALAAVDTGVEIRYRTAATRIVADDCRANAVDLDDGTRLDADAVVFNGDVAALTAGLLGEDVRNALPDRHGEARSLSAVTWSLCGRATGFPLEYHNVFFGADYAEEFDAIFGRGEICAQPTVYVCAQDRGAGWIAPRAGTERLFLLVNAPPRVLSEAEIARAERLAFELLARHGLKLGKPNEPGKPGELAKPGKHRSDAVVTTPGDFAELFPGSDGAVYGWPTHGWSATFRRHGSRADLDGLYLAGGTVHPGPGVPMAALSGRIAAASIRADLLR